MCSVCLFDKSGAMMIEEQGQLVSLPAKLDYFTDVDRGVETRTIVELPASPTPVKVQEKRGCSVVASRCESTPIRFISV